MARTTDHDSYLRFCSRQNLDRSFHQLEGVLQGILIDLEVSPGEAAALKDWCDALGEAGEQAPFAEAVASVRRMLQGGTIDPDDLEDLLWVAQRFTTPNCFYDVVAADIQRLHGLAMGLLADGVLTDEEVHSLSDWLEEHDHLRTVFPYDELCALLAHILEDGVVTEKERSLLQRFLVDIAPGGDKRVIQYAGIDVKKMTLPAVCAVDPHIPVDRSVFCFTGNSSRGTKAELTSAVERVGGSVRKSLTSEVDFLVVGSKGNSCWAFAKYGRKIEKAMKMRRKGGRILIVGEDDFWDALLDYE